MTIHLYLFRHCETDWNKDRNIKYCEEVHNVFLNELGIKQAENNAKALSNKNIQHIYASPLKRAYQTGKILANELNVGLDVIDDLKEFSTYDDSVIGLTRNEINEKIGVEKRKLRSEDKDALMDWRPLNCETKREARDRIYRTVINICEITPFKTIAIASHGNVLRELVRACNYEDDCKFKNCEVIEAMYSNGKLKIINRICNND